MRRDKRNHKHNKLIYLIRKIKNKIIWRIRSIRIVKLVITLAACCVSVSAIMGVVFLVYPTLALRALGLLPISWQNEIIINYLFTGGYGIIASVIVAILLWWVRTKIRF